MSKDEILGKDFSPGSPEPRETYTSDRRLSEFAKRTREFGHQIERWEEDMGRQPVSPERRQAVREWILEARNHTTDPDAFSVEALADDQPLDYVMLADIFQAGSELIRDID
jgi:hypothetical protein